MNKIAIIGATGATGLELIKLALQDGWKPSQIIAIASSRSVGKTINCQGQELTIQSEDALSEEVPLVVFLAAGGKVSEAFHKSNFGKYFVIDLSSHFRMNENYPLVIPEINPEDLKNDQRWICSPNCVTTITLMVLAPLIKKWPSKKVILSTYQAASGAGLKAMQELQKESQAFLNQTPYDSTFFPDPYAFNLFAHNSPFLNRDNNEEEIKIIQETRKILHDEKMHVSASCIRVPTLRAHAVSLYVEFQNAPTIEDLYQTLEKAPGVKLYEDFSKNRFATPQIAACQNEVYCGRIRKDTSCTQSFWFWIVGDQLLKGAALNAWQIFTLKRTHEAIHTDIGSNSSLI